MIVCLGWGSLCWCPRDLPIISDWRDDGPSLPIEFARQSGDGRITLVIAEDTEPVPVLWAKLNVPSLKEARDALAKREGSGKGDPKPEFIKKAVGFWSPDSSSEHCEAPGIGEWAKSHECEFSGVVWTALKPKFDSTCSKPTCKQVVCYLAKLEGEKKRRAEEYIRRAPHQIKTVYREEIESALG